MNAAHWHLAINHLPVVGVFFAACLLGFALLRNRAELYGVCLGAFVALAVLTVPVYLTGGRAENFLMEEAPDLDEALVSTHETAATVAFIGVGVLGVVALAGLWLGRKAAVVPRALAVAVFLLALAVSVLFGRAANLGGHIRHPETRPANPAAAVAPAKDKHE